MPRYTAAIEGPPIGGAIKSLRLMKSTSVGQKFVKQVRLPRQTYFAGIWESGSKNSSDNLLCLRTAACMPQRFCWHHPCLMFVQNIRIPCGPCAEAGWAVLQRVEAEWQSRHEWGGARVHAMLLDLSGEA